MLNRILAALIITSGFSLSAVIHSSIPPAAANDKPHLQAMEAAGYTLWNDGEITGVAFDVWTRTARQGGGFYYFLWEGHYADITDYGSPEVVVSFNSNIAQVNGVMIEDCFADGGYGTECLNPENKPEHFRHVGSCAFSWQTAVDGSVCGSRAAMVRQSGFQ